ncbi:MAG: hypothetical protein WC767_03785, partial [Candidatus Paceibacterota bacterium]
MKDTTNLAKSSLESLSPVAFFCAEYALGDASSSFAGGLGVLAADLLFEAADQGLPLVALGMRYEDTYPDKNGFEPVRDKSGEPIEI